MEKKEISENLPECRNSFCRCTAGFHGAGSSLETVPSLEAAGPPVDVSLVGAGPGDMELMTARALDRIRRAQVILYDQLIPISALNEAPLCAKLLYVGKVAARESVSQEEIHGLLKKYAKEGAYVVRLKGGDPMLFGRGGEEMEFMRREGISYELVPGISSSLSVPSHAGIPLTHRDCSFGVSIITGHRAVKGEEGREDYAHWAKSPVSLVFLMAAGNSKAIAEKLLGEGMAADTPVSIISSGYGAKEVRKNCTLFGLYKGEGDPILRPAILVIGKSAALDLRSLVPPGKLFGKRILLTGTRRMQKSLEPLLKGAGAEVLSVSLIENIKSREGSLSEAIDSLGNYSWIVFTSPQGVISFFEALRNHPLVDARALFGLSFAVIGSATAGCLAEYGCRYDFMPGEYTGAAMVREWLPLLTKEDRVLLCRAKEGGEDLPRGLSEAEIPFFTAAAYETIRDERRRGDLNRVLPGVDFIVCTSSLGARALYDMAKDTELLKEKIVAIGPVTADTLKELSLPPLLVAEKHTAEGILKALEEWV